jgi:hypothetical protein
MRFFEAPRPEIRSVIFAVFNFNSQHDATLTAEMIYRNLQI